MRRWDELNTHKTHAEKAKSKSMVLDDADKKKKTCEEWAKLRDKTEKVTTRKIAIRRGFLFSL